MSDLWLLKPGHCNGWSREITLKSASFVLKDYVDLRVQDRHLPDVSAHLCFTIFSHGFYEYDPSHGFEADMTPEEIFNMFFGGGILKHFVHFLLHFFCRRIILNLLGN